MKVKIRLFEKKNNFIIFRGEVNGFFIFCEILSMIQTTVPILCGIVKASLPSPSFINIIIIIIIIHAHTQWLADNENLFFPIVVTQKRKKLYQSNYIPSQGELNKIFCKSIIEIITLKNKLYFILFYFIKKIKLIAVGCFLIKKFIHIYY